MGKTKRGKGTKWLFLVDGQGLPVACRTASASPAEVTLVEDLAAQVTIVGGPVPLIADRAYDNDPHLARLKRQGFDLVCPHRRGCKLRRYQHRWKIERTISWLGNYRRLLVRHEYHIHMFQGFITLACLSYASKGFETASRGFSCVQKTLDFQAIHVAHPTSSSANATDNRHRKLQQSLL